MPESGVNYKVGDSNQRPWGTWEVVTVGERHIVKKITVSSGQILSLQRHQFRSEHWVVVSGMGKITLDDKVWEVKADTATYIPKKAMHRIENHGTEDLCFIEIQIGDTLDENDIERFDDRYGRVSAGA